MEYSPSPTAQDAGRTGTPLMEQAKEQAHQLVDRTKEMTGQAVDRARTQMKSGLESQKDRAAGSLHTVAQALRQTGEQLRTQDEGTVGNYADSAARMVDQVSTFLQERRVDDMLMEVEGFARRQPVAFLAGAFTLGFLAGRFLKSSASRGDSRFEYEKFNDQSRTWHEEQAGTPSWSESGSFGTPSPPPRPADVPVLESAIDQTLEPIIPATPVMPVTPTSPGIPAAPTAGTPSYPPAPTPYPRPLETEDVTEEETEYAQARDARQGDV